MKKGTNYLRAIRIVMAVFFFTAVILLFFGAWRLNIWLGWTAKLQFLPALMALDVAVLVGLIAFRFLGTYQVTELVVNQISLSSYFSLFIVLALLLGLFFEVPVLTWFLARMGILSADHLRRYRRHVFVAILILAAVITPTGDPFTLLLVTLPVYLLYELSILLIRPSSVA